MSLITPVTGGQEDGHLAGAGYLGQRGHHDRQQHVERLVLDEQVGQLEQLPQFAALPPFRGARREEHGDDGEQQDAVQAALPTPPGETSPSIIPVSTAPPPTGV